MFQFLHKTFSLIINLIFLADSYFSCTLPQFCPMISLAFHKAVKVHRSQYETIQTECDPEEAAYYEAKQCTYPPKSTTQQQRSPKDRFIGFVDRVASIRVENPLLIAIDSNLHPPNHSHQLPSTDILGGPEINTCRNKYKSESQNFASTGHEKSGQMSRYNRMGSILSKAVMMQNHILSGLLCCTSMWLMKTGFSHQLMLMLLGASTNQFNFWSRVLPSIMLDIA